MLADPAPTVARLHAAWAGPRARRRRPRRRPGAVPRAAVDRRSSRGALAPESEPWFDRLHFLVWANTYDARAGEPVWWWARQGGPPRRRRRRDARRAGRRHAARRHAGVDRRRARGIARRRDGLVVVHSDSVDLGRLAVVPPPVAPDADLAPDQLAAVAHVGGPARVIAPAGSGKTRVLTERLRHLHVDRGYEPATVLAVAYNKQAQLEMEARTTDFRPRVRTLNSLGLWVLAEHRGASPPVHRRARGAPPRRLAAPGPPPAAGQHRSDRPVPRGRSRTIRLGLTDPERRRGGARRRARPRPSCSRPFRDQLAAARRRRLRRADLRRRRGAARRRRRSAARCSARCRHLLVDEFQDLTPAHVLLAAAALAARRSTCSASATTTSASTATPAPTRRSSSTTSGCSRAPRRTR